LHTNYFIFGITKPGTPNLNLYLARMFLEESAILFSICKTTSQSLAKGRTPIRSLFTKSLSYPGPQFLCTLDNQGTRVQRRKSSEASKGFHVSRNRQFPLSLHTHFSGLLSIRMVFSLSMRLLPMNSFSERTFRKISFDPPITVRYLPAMSQSFDNCPVQEYQTIVATRKRGTGQFFPQWISSLSSK
jgi:hypothetical protein